MRFLLIFFLSLSIFAEDMISVEYSLRGSYNYVLENFVEESKKVDTESTDDEDIFDDADSSHVLDDGFGPSYPDGVGEDFVEKFKKVAVANKITFPKESSVKIDKRRGKLVMTNTMLNHYHLFSQEPRQYAVEAMQVKFHIELIEVVNNQMLLNQAPNGIDAETFRALPAKNRKHIAEFDILTQNGSTALVVAQGNTVEITPQIDPDGESIEVEMRWQYKDPSTKRFLSSDTRFKTIDRGSIAFQVQSATAKSRKNLYLVVSNSLVDNELNEIHRFLKKDIEAIRQKLIKAEGPNRRGTRFYQISTGFVSYTDDYHEKQARLSEDDSSERPDYKTYFEGLGIKFEEDDIIKFIPASMKIHMVAKESTLRKVDQLLNDLSIQTPQCKLNFQIVEVENDILKKLPPGQITSAVLKNVPAEKRRIIENLECLAVSGKTILAMDLKGPEVLKGLVLEATMQADPIESQWTIEMKLDYQMNGLKAFVDQEIKLKGAKKQVIQLQVKDGKSYFLIISADEYVVETPYW